jgi:hypothetical protein
LQLGPAVDGYFRLTPEVSRNPRIIHKPTSKKTWR